MFVVFKFKQKYCSLFSLFYEILKCCMYIFFLIILKSQKYLTMETLVLADLLFLSAYFFMLPRLFAKKASFLPRESR